MSQPTEHTDPDLDACRHTARVTTAYRNEHPPALSPSTSRFQSSYPALSSNEDEEELREDSSYVENCWTARDRIEAVNRAHKLWENEYCYPGWRKLARWRERRSQEEKYRNKHMRTQRTWDHDLDEKNKAKEETYRKGEIAANRDTNIPESVVEQVRCQKFEECLWDLGFEFNHPTSEDSGWDSYDSYDTYEDLSEKEREVVARWAEQTSVYYPRRAEPVSGDKSSDEGGDLDGDVEEDEVLFLGRDRGKQKGVVGGKVGGRSKEN